MSTKLYDKYPVSTATQAPVSTNTIAPQELKPIPDAIKTMDIELTHLSDVCEQLEKQLTPVLRPQNMEKVQPEKVQPENVKSNEIELVATLDCFNHSINDISSCLKGIMDRLGI